MLSSCVAYRLGSSLVRSDAPPPRDQIGAEPSGRSSARRAVMPFGRERVLSDEAFDRFARGSPKRERSTL